MRYETGTFELRDNDMMMRELSSAETDAWFSAVERTVSADLVGDAVVNGSYHLDKLPGVSQWPNQCEAITPFSGSHHGLTLSAQRSIHYS